MKASVYATHTFFTVYAVQVLDAGCDDSDTMLSMHRISAFVLLQALITVRLPPVFDIDDVPRRWDEIGGQEYGVGPVRPASDRRGGWPGWVGSLRLTVG